jgi:hypothetical protein
MRCFSLAAALLVASTTAFAQQHGAIKGYIKDAQGAVLPGVTIATSSPELMGTQTTVSDSEGHDRFLSLPPRNYRLEASLAGFGTYIRDNLRVQVASTTAENITLQVATVTEQVTVTATAPVIDIEAAVRASNINQTAISNIPVAPRVTLSNGRRVADFVWQARNSYLRRQAVGRLRPLHGRRVQPEHPVAKRLCDQSMPDRCVDRFLQRVELHDVPRL